MRNTSQLLLLTLLMTSLAVAYCSHRTNADDQNADEDAEKVYPMSYRITDLPVWSADGNEFNPGILMAYLKTTVAVGEWNGPSTMTPYPKKTCLIISTTSANHDAIATAIESLRTLVAVAPK